MKRIFALYAIVGILVSCVNTKEVEQKTAEAKDQGVEKTNSEVAPTPQRMPDLNNGASELADGTIIERQTINTKPMSIEWLDFETAIDRNQENPKYIFIDLYTDWCGWCKKMDASTFVNSEVVAYMNEYFYAVKMNAEMREAIAYNGQLYEYKQFNSKSGYNTLAVGLLDSQMSFPSFVVLDKKEVKKGKIMGYKEATTFLIELKKYVK